ncbi:DEAD/DEAH box helicase family protein [Candidatus Palauibacter sp.]|uniref:DEAD/DEAH box helicase family protein n=1 Tax=Candidatus Palauibacter sp. TaxID=3101350 RepID=UPI003B51E94D
MEQAVCLTPEEASQRVVDVFRSGKADASALAQHALDCLAWMIATGTLRLRIAIPTADSNYHPKVWLFDDGADQMLVRGSGNATARGIGSGVEHFDVDVTWVGYSRQRVHDGMAILNDWSWGKSRGIERVVELPQALREEVIQTAPDRPPGPADYSRAADEDDNPAWAVDRAARLAKRFGRAPVRTQPRLEIPPELIWEDGPYRHQGEAVAAWESGPDPELGTISMATGAGKTITALICATRLQDRLEGRPLLVVVSAPSIPLIQQWCKEANRFGVRAVAPTLEPSTDMSITNLFRRLHGGGTHILIVTNHLISSPSFQATVAEKTQSHRLTDTLFIGDEVHTLGAAKFVTNKPEFFTRRLGLSATPERQYDPDGTEEIFTFFGNPVYEYGLDRAIGFCLTPYDYCVHATTLEEDEVTQFEQLSQRIRIAMAVEREDVGNGDDTLERRLLIQRRKIIERATGKLSLLRQVLKQRGPRFLDGALIYATAKDPEQFDKIGVLLNNLGIRWAPVTQETTAKPSLLASRLEAFSDGGYQVLLAKKVLDEGVDIPRIREAFIVASSTVEREWIQRRGRVLRRHRDKPFAVVHDFLALPPTQLVAQDWTSVQKIVRTEFNRAYTFAKFARNATGGDSVFADLGRIRSAFQPERGTATLLQRSGDSFVSSGTPRGSI